MRRPFGKKSYTEAFFHKLANGEDQNIVLNAENTNRVTESKSLVRILKLSTFSNIRWPMHYLILKIVTNLEFQPFKNYGNILTLDCLRLRPIILFCQGIYL